jgi:SPP1 family holin
MKKILDRIKSLDKGTIIRTLVLIVTIINQVVAFISQLSGWYLGLSIVALVISAVIAWWSNNDITPAAQLATKMLNALQDGKISAEEVKELLDKQKQKEKVNSRKIKK